MTEPDPGSAEADEKLRVNERAKLLAMALNTVAGSCITIGLARTARRPPLRSGRCSHHDLLGRPPGRPDRLHYRCGRQSHAGPTRLEGAAVVTSTYAVYLAAPFVILALCYIGVRVHEWDLARHRRSPPTPGSRPTH